MPANAFQTWLKDSKAKMPKDGVAGVLGEWVTVGTLDVAGKALDAADLWVLAPEDGTTIKVKPGRFVVQARGMSFGKHRRVAGMRVFADGADVERGAQLAEVPVDSWGVAVGEIDACFKGLADEDVSAFAEKRIGVYADGCEIETVKVGGRTGQWARAFTGLGSGGYPVFELEAGRGLVGLEFEFIEDGFVA